MTQEEFEALIIDNTKKINHDITWDEDEDHSPSLEFQIQVDSDPSYPIILKGSYNPLSEALSYVLIHKKFGRIYALDMGKEHRNPAGELVGEKHKHRWDEVLRDKKAYEPDDITASKNNPVAVWRQFCEEAKIIHNGTMQEPPPLQLEAF
jgi:hypothetical protein